MYCFVAFALHVVFINSGRHILIHSKISVSDITSDLAFHTVDFHAYDCDIIWMAHSDVWVLVD